MKFWFCWILFASALAEFGLIAISSSQRINGATVRIKDGRLAFDTDEPLLQAHFVNDTVVLSDWIVAESAVGAGIGPDAEGCLSVLSSPAHNFNQTNNFLTYNASALFSVKETKDLGWRLFIDWMNPQYRGIPVMFQITEIVYPTPPLKNIQNDGLNIGAAPQNKTDESNLILQATSSIAASITERPTVFSTVYETIVMPKTQTDPKTSTFTIYQEIMAIFTTETVTARPTILSTGTTP